MDIKDWVILQTERVAWMRTQIELLRAGKIALADWEKTAPAWYQACDHAFMTRELAKATAKGEK